MAAEKGPNILFCMSNRTTCIRVVSVTCAGAALLLSHSACRVGLSVSFRFQLRNVVRAHLAPPSLVSARVGVIRGHVTTALVRELWRLLVRRWRRWAPSVIP
jgi:hypothetical protein